MVATGGLYCAAVVALSGGRAALIYYLQCLGSRSIGDGSSHIFFFRVQFVQLRRESVTHQPGWGAASLYESGAGQVASSAYLPRPPATPVTPACTPVNDLMTAEPCRAG
jgi:hypothetical protein